MERKIRNIVRHAEVSEKAIEKYLTERVRQAGGLCLKYANMNEAGYPDRLVLLPGNWTAWVELKSKGRKPARLQELRMEALRHLGQRVTVIDSREGVDGLINEWRAEHEV